MTQPTGVFVRLPLSDEQREAFITSVDCGEEVEAGILAIGTPVTGGDASAVDYSEYEPEYHDQGMGCGLEDRGIHDRYEAMGYGWDQAMERVCSEFPETVLLSDHQAAIASLEAEVGRLREVLQEQKAFHESEDKALSKQPPSSQGAWRRNQHQEQIELIEAALKGPEA